MKYVPFLTLALFIALPVSAQDAGVPDAPPAQPPAQPVPAPEAPAEPDAPAAPAAPDQVAEPEPEVSEPEPEVSEPEPEVSNPVVEPEPEVSQPVEPEPEVSDAAGGLGTAAPEANTQEDIQEARQEAVQDAELEELVEEGPDNGSGGGTLSAAERLSSMTGAQGVSWTFPLSWSNNLTVDSMRPQHRPTYDPFFSMTFSAAPRYIFTPIVSIGARMSLDIEMTDSGGGGATSATPEGRDLEWGDLQLDTTFALPWRPGGVGFAPSIALRLPTSQLSRGQSRALGPTVRLAVVKAFDVADGLIIGGALGYTYWIHSQGTRRFREGTAGVDNTGTDSTGAPLVIRDAGAATGCSRGSLIADPTSFGTGGCNGGNQVRHQPSIAAFVAFVPTSGVTISASFAAFWLANRDHDATFLPPDQVITPDGQPLSVEDNSLTHTTTVTSFSASVGYDFKSWLTATIGYSTLSFYPDSDGSFENFIYNENSQFNLSLSFRPSALVTSLRADDEEEAEEEEEEDPEPLPPRREASNGPTRLAF